MHGSGAQSLRPRRGAATARTHRARPGDPAVRGGARADSPRAPGAEHGAHRTPRRRQDRLAEHLQVDGPATAVGDRQDRSQAGSVDQAPGRGRAAHGGAGTRAPASRPAPRHRPRGRVKAFLGVLKAFALRDPKALKGSSVTIALGIDVPAQRGRADSGDLEVDLTQLFAEGASVAADLGVGIALFVDEMQDVPSADVSALCAACHELSQTGGPLIVVGAGLPHLPSVLSASKSYSERLFRYARIDRLEREAADLALLAPAQREGADFEPDALDALYQAADGYPYFVQAYGKVTWDVAAASPGAAADVSGAAPEAEGELAVGFFGSRYERATPAEREYMRAMAATGDDPVPTSIVADELGRKPSSLSPARDGLIKKGLIYSSERGLIAFTVPHFGKFLRSQPI